VLYSVFAAEDYYSKALHKSCFEYFKHEGACVDGPAGLLASITKKPLVLMYHFFAVALLSI
jgi:squalene monooxygenase